MVERILSPWLLTAMTVLSASSISIIKNISSSTSTVDAFVIPSVPSGLSSSRSMRGQPRPTVLSWEVGHTPYSRHRSLTNGTSKGCAGISSSSTTTTLLRALVYGADGQISKETTSSTESSRDKGTSTNSDLYGDDALRDALMMSKVDITALLTTVACAMAPPPHNHIHPRLVARTDLVRVGPDTLEVALAVPASEGPNSQLARILVSVTLPSQQSTTDVEDISYNHDDAGTVLNKGDDDSNKSQLVSTIATSIIQKLQQLEAEAYTILAQREDQLNGSIESTISTSSPRPVVASAVQQQEQQRLLLAALQEEPSAIDLPNWWTFVELKILLSNECTFLKSMLNEDDFASDLLALCRMYYGKTTTTTTATASATLDSQSFRLAKVAAIGPSGIVLKASSLDDYDIDNIFTVAIPFPQRRPAVTADDLRDYVLTLVETVEQQQQQQQKVIPPSLPVVVTETVDVSSSQLVSPDSFTQQVTSSLSTAAPAPPDDVVQVTVEDDGVVPKKEPVVVAEVGYDVKLELSRRRMLEERMVREQKLVASVVQTVPVTKEEVTTLERSLRQPDDDVADDQMTTTRTRTDEAVIASRLEILRRNLLHTRLQEQYRAAQLEAELRTELCRRRMLQFRLEIEQRPLEGELSISEIDSDSEEDRKNHREYDEGFGTASTSSSPSSSSGRADRSRKQPLSLQEEAKLAAKYAAIEDLGERAYAIVKDLALI